MDVGLSLLELGSPGQGDGGSFYSGVTFAGPTSLCPLKWRASDWMIAEKQTALDFEDLDGVGTCPDW